MENKFYILPKLPYEYNALQPFMSEEQLMIHHRRPYITFLILE
jgi:Fe-Mn family superoxide dismutase